MPQDNLKILSKELGLPFTEKITLGDIPQEIFLKLPISLFREYKCVPLEVRAGALILAAAFPFNLNFFDDLSRSLGMKVEFVLAYSEEIDGALESVYSKHTTSQEAADEVKDSELEDTRHQEDKPEDLLDIANKPPIIKLVNTIIFEAVKNRATDIHIQPYADSLKVRYRVDGFLHDTISLPKDRQSAVISRIKVMSKLNIAEQRLSQDGRITINIGKKAVDIRVSCIPTSFGERVVLRLLDKNASLLRLDQIGLSESLLKQLRRLINLPNGIILVTGPTGSGKTTTLYAGLSEINTAEKNIITIEDPIEYYLEGVSQMQVQPKIGLSFASGLRSVLRQDPDIIMVGEIRDKETATISIQAALTGHLVLSTLHTNSACGAIERLLDLGIESYFISSAVAAVLAQRLVRLVCPHCLKPYAPDKEFLAAIKIDNLNLPDTLRRGIGCAECLNTGYRGRIGIFELLVLSEEIKQMILSGAKSIDIGKKAEEQGMLGLFSDGLDKVRSGLTTLEEVYRLSYFEM